MARATAYMIGVSNVSPQQAAEHFAQNGFGGFVTEGLGFTSEWGQEVGISIRIATTRPRADLVETVVGFLSAWYEEAAYFEEVGEAPLLLWRDGRFTGLNA